MEHLKIGTVRFVVTSLVTCSMLLATPVTPSKELSVGERLSLRKKSALHYRNLRDPREYERERFQFLRNRRLDLIKKIEALLPGMKKGDHDANLKFRLARLCREERYAVQALDQRLAESKTQAEKDKRQARVQALVAKLMSKERGLYEHLTATYPKHPQRDSMLFHLAITHFDEGDFPKAKKYFDLVISEYPASPLVDDILIQTGDYYFNLSKLKLAEAQYDQVIARKQKGGIAYALYKKAWCRYNLGGKRESLDYFKRSIAHEDNGDPAFTLRLRSEVVRDMIFPFADLNLVSEAVAFYKRLDPPLFRIAMESMAVLLVERGERKRAIRLWEDLIATDPTHRSSPAYRIQIVEALILENLLKDAVVVAKRSASEYLTDSYWRQANKQTKGSLKETDQAWEALIRKYATHFHAVGQRMNNKEKYPLAWDLYELYLSHFEHWPEAPQMRFYLADILRTKKKYEQAASQYRLVHATHTAENIREESLRKAMEALLNATNRENVKNGRPVITAESRSVIAAKIQSVEPYSDGERNLVEVIAQYLQTFPKSPYGPEMLYQMGYLQYSHSDLEPAYRSFQQLITSQPKHVTARSAAYLVLDILNRQKKYLSLVEVCRDFLKNRHLRQPEFDANVSRVLRQSELSLVNELEAEKKYAEAAEAYFRYAKEYGSEDVSLWEKSLYNAGVNYSRAGLERKAMVARETLLKQFPKSQFRPELVLKLAKANESMGRFKSAATYFELFATDYPRHADAPNALRLAGLYHWAGKQPKKAEAAMQKHMAQYRGMGSLVEEDLLELFASTGNHRAELQLLKKMRGSASSTPGRALQLSMRELELEARRLGKWPRAQLDSTIKFAERNRTALLKSESGNTGLARALFLKEHGKDEEFHRIRLNSPASLQKSLEKKLALLKDLERSYAKVIALGGEWGLAAAYRTAVAYRNFAKDAQSAPAPRGLSGEELGKYRSEIERAMVTPFQKKAAGFASGCVTKARELKLLSAWTPQCFALASQLQPPVAPSARTFYLPAVRVAIVAPEPDRSKIAAGDLHASVYPYFSSFLFQSDEEMASVPPRAVASLRGPVERFALGAPQARPINYLTLSRQRDEALKESWEDSREGEAAKTIAALNLLRFSNPERASEEIQIALQENPGEPALLNLLALTQLDRREFATAKITWLSMIAQGSSSAAVLNNLGVVSMLQGKEEQAVRYFKESAALPDVSGETWANLGSLALKYSSPVEAEESLRKAIELNSNDLPSRVSSGVALLQKGDIEGARKHLDSLFDDYEDDPYLRVSLAYLAMDTSHDIARAKELLKGPAGSAFRDAIQELHEAEISRVGLELTSSP